MAEQVRVRRLMPPGHVRAPAYLRGKEGVVHQSLGPFANPEQLAYGVPAGRKNLFRVLFTMREIWGDRAERPDDTLCVELYEHWLERLD